MAKLINCPTCSSSVSSSASKCIHCGHVLKSAARGCLISSALLGMCFLTLIVGSMIFKKSQDQDAINAYQDSIEREDDIYLLQTRITKSVRSAYYDPTAKPINITELQLCVAAIATLNNKDIASLKAKKHIDDSNVIYEVYYTRDDGKSFNYLLAVKGSEISYMSAKGPNRWNENIRLYWSENTELNTVTIEMSFNDGSTDSKVIPIDFL